MKTNTLRRTGGLAALALTLSVGMAACSSDDDTASDTTTDATSAPADTESTPAETESSEAATTDAGADTFGDGCSAIPAGDAEGSFNGMATEPVATAASTNPLLKTLVAAVTAADLVDTLNTLPAATVFAPTDDAFKKIPEDTLNSVLADKKTLTSILTYHVLPEQLDPTAIVGEQTTVQGATLEVTGDETGMKVNDANVICGNIPTANATVYVIDTVLMPPAA